MTKDPKKKQEIFTKF